MERLTNKGSKGEIWISDTDETRRWGRKESAYRRLAEYEDLEEQGRLVKLPCKVGDTVYFIKNSETIVKRKADMIFIGIFWEEFCKKWFPTREEAEAKLKELRGKNE
jgi:hypothetical protein